MANARNVMTELGGMNTRRQQIKSNPDLSEAGKERALAALKQQEDSYRTTALTQLKADWDSLKGSSRRLREMRQKAEQAAADAWDYGRLQYMRQSAEAAIRKANDPGELEQLYGQAAKTGDLHARRAWAEAVTGELPGHLSSKTGLGGLVKRAKDDLGGLMTTPELESIRQAEQDLVGEALVIDDATRAAGRFYQAHMPVSGLDLDKMRAADNQSQDFHRLAAGVNILRRLDPLTLTEQAAVEIAD
jgi:hypothetical protein